MNKDEASMVVYGRKKRTLRQQWLQWSHQAHLYRDAEECLDRVAAGDTRQVHRYDFPVYFCADQPGLEPMQVHAEVTVDGIRLSKLRQLWNGAFEVLNIMEWPFDRYAVHVSDDGIEVRFRSSDPDDPGSNVYIRSGSVHGDLGFRVNVALGIRRDGLDAGRQALHAARLAHLELEPDRSAMSALDLRTHEGGQRSRAAE